ncbi:AsmA-like C-terminal region-containing protein [Aestuariicoccus sp. MJ-SS9]|uniref:YhdP family protein n=1 Tax=Aestuariicoccus sp. MJ-SS9 TaxID=3079855 RepID=UPI00290BC3C6|nr:AsmA-like C-terminal region-containing protein [Aestuariicoccus sp. MJ-SS9]MDU8911037.1 AsmA-like C-terminal region-containing protein [Aestuariicoccus sp. MJ-SS9]
MKETEPTRRKTRRWPWAAAPLALILAIGGLLMLGRAVSAPDWLRERIEARIDVALPGLDLRFGDMQVQVQRNGLPQVMLWDVDIRTDDGVPVAAFGDVRAALSPKALARGKIVLRDASVSGAILTLTRGPDGRIAVALGDVFAADTATPDLPTLIAQVDRALADPRLARLRSVTADALTLRYEDARAHRGWTLDGGVLRLTRDDGRLQLGGNVAILGGGDTAASIELNAQSVIGDTGMDFGLTLRGLSSNDIATQSPALAWLDALHAPISGALRGALTPEGALGPLSATLQIGEGVLQPNEGTRAIPFKAARTYFTYKPDSATLDFDEISVSSELGELLADGRAVLEGIEDGWPRALTGQFAVSRLMADPGDLMPEPVELAGAEMDFRLDLKPFRFRLGRLRLTDEDLPLRLSGDVLALREGWQLALDARLDGATRDQVLRYWPPRVTPRTRDWVERNVARADIRHAVAALRLSQGQKPDLYLDLRFEDADVRYARTLPPVTGGSGQLTIYENRLSVLAEGGTVDPGQGGTIDIAGTSFVIPNVRERPARGEVQVAANAPLTAALAYLDSDPLNIMQKAGRPVDLGQGQVIARGRVDLPLVRPMPKGAVRFGFEGEVRDAASDQIVPGRDLRADLLTFAADNDLVEVAGRATLSGVPFEGSWRQPLGTGAGSRVAGRVTLSQAAVEAFNIGLPAGSVRGSGPGDLTVELPKGGPPRFALTSELAGVGLRIPPLGWSLAPETRGTLQVAGTLGKPAAVETLRLDAPGLLAEGSVALKEDGSLDRVVMSRLRAGGWLDAPVTLRGRGAGRAPAVQIAGGRIDMRNLPSSGGGGSGGGPIAIAVNRLQVSEGIALTDFRGEFSSGGGLNGKFTGKVNGAAAIAGEVTPQKGRSAFRISAEDAGSVFSAAGLLKTAAGGALSLTLAPVAGVAGTYDGRLDVKDIRLRDAPAFGALLDAISIVGLIDQLNGPGIYFAEVEGRFRLTPNQLILTRSSAVGPSMGVSLDGYYDLASKRMDMQGVLSPIYILNGIGRIFSRKGEGLIGFNFNLSGAAEKPRVAVNPLSIFTPGMFREIFRRPPPDVSQ